MDIDRSFKWNFVHKILFGPTIKIEKKKRKWNMDDAGELNRMLGIIPYYVVSSTTHWMDKILLDFKRLDK